MISDHGQEAELLSRHLMYLCSHSMPRVRSVLLVPHLWPSITERPLPLSGYGLPLVPSCWTAAVPDLAPHHRLISFTEKEVACRLPPAA